MRGRNSPGRGASVAQRAGERGSGARGGGGPPSACVPRNACHEGGNRFRRVPRWKSISPRAPLEIDFAAGPQLEIDFAAGQEAPALPPAVWQARVRACAARTALQRSRNALQQFFPLKNVGIWRHLQVFLCLYHTELSLKGRFGGSTPSCLLLIVSSDPFAPFKTFNLYP